MPPQKRQSGKGKVKAAASHTPLLDQENAEASAPNGAAYNVELLQSAQEALAALKDLWPGLAEEAALGIGDGGQQAAFDANQCKRSLFGEGNQQTSSYRCAQNLMKCDIFFNADPSVPLRQKSINEIGERYYNDPSPFHDNLCLAVPADWMQQSCDITRAKPVSPMENVIAFLLSIYRDMDDEVKMDQWKRYFLSVNCEYVIASSDDEIYFLSANGRQSLKADQETMTHTCLQKIFSVLNYKARLEKITGPLSTETFCQKFAERYRPASEEERVTDAFVDTSITLSRRVLSVPSLLNLLLAADEEGSSKNVFSSWTKLQVIVQRSKTSKNVEWCFHSLYDGWKNSHLPSEMMTWRGLKDALNGKGSVDVFVGQMEFKDLLFNNLVPTYSWDEKITTLMRDTVNLHTTYREKCGWSFSKDVDLTWRGGWPRSAELFWSFLEDLLYSDTFLPTLKNLIRHRKPVADWMDNTEIMARLDAVKKQHTAEVKASKNNDQEETGEDDLPIEDDDQGAKGENEEDDPTGTAHMEVLPQITTQRPKRGGGKEAVQKFKKKASQTVRTHVRLVVEEDNMSNMTKAFQGTAFVDWKAEVCQTTNQITKMVAIYFDTKTVGEAQTQPTLRLPPLREGRHAKLLGSAIGLRFNPDIGGMNPGDGVVVLDGGRDGLQAPILSAIKPPSSEPMSKVKVVKYLMWDEKSIRERKHRDRGSAVNQMERMIIVTSEEMGWSFHNRVHYSGTNRGDVIAPIKAPSWDDKDETWRLSLANKKLLFAANRVAVGNKPDVQGTDKQGRRRDADEEPVAYHAMPKEAVNEIFEELNIGYMLDLSCCDGKTAFAAICRRCPYIGLVFTPDHATLLMKRLEAMVFQAMQTSSSPLFEPALAQLLAGSSKKAAKARPKKKAKKDDDDDELDDNEDEGGEPDEQEEEDEDDGEDQEEAEEEGSEDEGEDEDDASMEGEDEGPEEEEEDEGEQDEDDEGEPNKGSKRKATEKAKSKAKAKGGAKAKAKPKAKAKAKGKASAKKKAAAKGRPKAGSKKASDVLAKLRDLQS